MLQLLKLNAAVSVKLLMANSRDAEASYSVKKAANGKKTATYGFKAHTNVDEDGFVKKLTYTTGSVHDSQEFERLLTYDEQVVYADKAYDSKEHRQHKR